MTSSEFKQLIGCLTITEAGDLCDRFASQKLEADSQCKLVEGFYGSAQHKKLSGDTLKALYDWVHKV